MTKSKGYRSSTRNMMTKDARKRGMQPLGRLLVEHKPGDKAVVIIDPSYHKGMPHKRFHGKVGIILEKRGRSYLVKVADGERQKVIISKPEHLKSFPSV